jgi:hypothetical protein
VSIQLSVFAPLGCRMLSCKDALGSIDVVVCMFCLSSVLIMSVIQCVLHQLFCLFGGSQAWLIAVWMVPASSPQLRGGDC